MGRLERARKIEKAMKATNLGYGDNPTFNLMVGPDPFYLSLEEPALLEARGRYFREWLEVSNALYVRGLSDPTLEWVVRLIEGVTSDEVREVQRNAFEEGRVRLPLFGRADQPNLEKTIEMQIPGSGWGYMLGASNVFASICKDGQPWGEGLDVAFVRAMRELSGKENPRVIHVLHNEGHLREAESFAQACSQRGIQMEVSLREVPELDGVDVIRRPPLRDLLSFPGGGMTVELYLGGKIEMEPPPNLLYDEKAAMVLPFHPQTSRFYSDGVRELFPETHLVTRLNPPQFEGELIFWDEIPELSKSQRRFILKYAGSNPRTRGNARAVFNLQDSSRAKTEELIRCALDDWNLGEPWLIQRRIKEKFPVTLLAHEGNLCDVRWYARFNPMYYLGDNPHVTGGCATFRNFWKVSAGEDHLILGVHVR